MFDLDPTFVLDDTGYGTTPAAPLPQADDDTLLDSYSRTVSQVAAIETGSPAEAAGLAAGDLVLALDGQPVTGADDLIRALNGERIGRAVPLVIIRQGARLEAEIRPAEKN